MKRFIEEANRTQASLLPECLDDFVAEDNPIRIVEVFVEQLDLADGRFGKQDFVYVPKKNEYRCPAWQSLIYRYMNIEAGLTTHAYRNSNGKQCALRSQCPREPFRRVRRWEHEDVIDAMQRRLDHQPEMMGVRRQTVEQPFGTLKHWMGSTHFLTKTLP